MIGIIPITLNKLTLFERSARIKKQLKRIVTEEFKLFPFLKYYKKNRSLKYIVRCLACRHIQQGMSYEVVSKIVKYSRQTIGEWVKMYNEGGIDKMLSIRKGRGRKARIKMIKRQNSVSM